MTAGGRAGWRAVGGLVLLLATAGCGSGAAAPPASTGTPEPTATERTSRPEPCPDGATVELGRPFRGQRWAEFDSAGGELHVTVRQFETGGVLDPEVGRSAVFVGPASTPPTYDRQTGRVGGATERIGVVQGQWSAFVLPEGRYWLWATNGWDVAVRSCEPGGVSGAVAVL